MKAKTVRPIPRKGGKVRIYFLSCRREGRRVDCCSPRGGRGSRTQRDEGLFFDFSEEFRHGSFFYVFSVVESFVSRYVWLIMYFFYFLGVAAIRFLESAPPSTGRRC